MQTILKRTVDYYGGSLIALRRSYGHYLGSRQSTPLPLKANLVLVPLKMRSPLIENDSVTGFVNACSVIGLDSVQTTEETKTVKCMLQLSGGLAVPSYYSIARTEKRLLMGRLALDRFCRLQGIDANCGALLTRERSSQLNYEAYGTIGKLVCELMSEKEVCTCKTGCNNTERDCRWS